jgi:3',5'-cyclic AMP phosphodiesterase CpdA
MTLSRNLVLAIVLVTLLPASNATAELTFVQISDAHFSPDLVRIPEAVALRGAATVAWIQEHAAGPQAVQPWGLTTPMPAYAVFTGDVFEFGVIDRTAEQLERAFGDWPFPVWVLPGNHDNTWGALYRYLRARHGGTNYAVDRGGVRLLNISSASPQEPVPSIDGGTRAWLREQLDQTPAGQPVIVALHHPLHDKTLAPAEYDTLIDLLRDHHVVLALYGHGHGVVHPRPRRHRRRDGRLDLWP